MDLVSYGFICRNIIMRISVALLFMVNLSGLILTSALKNEGCSSSKYINVSIGDTMHISSPGYPEFYPSHSDCQWFLHSNDTDGSYIVTFADFIISETEAYSDLQASEDYFAIGRGLHVTEDTRLIRLSKFVALGSTIVVSEGNIWLKFFSDFLFHNRGFLVNVHRKVIPDICSGHDPITCNRGVRCYEGALFCQDQETCSLGLDVDKDCRACRHDDFWCFDGNGCLDKSLLCDNVMQCLDGSDEYNCYSCHNEDIFVLHNSTFVTSPNFPRDYEIELGCTWKFASPNSLSIFDIKFRFTQIDEAYDIVTVGYGSNIQPNNTVLLLDHLYFPRIVSIRHREIWMQFTSDDVLGYAGFFVEISRRDVIGNESGVCLDHEFPCASGYGCLDRSLLCDGVKDCYDETDELDCDYCGPTNITLSPTIPSTLQSPQHPYPYLRRLSCEWLISAASPDGFIVITFEFFHMEYNYDFLYIGYGSKVNQSAAVARVTGAITANTMTLNATSAWALMTSDGAIEWHGFRLRFEFKDVFEPCHDDEFACASGHGCINHTLVCDGHPHCLHESDEMGCDLCGSDTYNVTEVQHPNISSPGYPSIYPNNLDCSWTLTAEKGDGIIIEFIDFAIEPEFDFLKIGLGDLGDSSQAVFNLSGPSSPNSAVIDATHAWMRFTADRNLGDRGFWLQLTLLQVNETFSCDVEEFTCNGESIQLCLHSRLVCDDEPMCPSKEDEQNCGICGIRNINLRTDDPYALKSPNYPKYYPNELVCQWLVAATASRIIVHILNFEMERGYDFFVIGNGLDSTDQGSILGRLTGSVKLQTVTSDGPSMWMRMATDRTGTAKGFEMELQKSDEIGECRPNAFNCGEGLCVISDAKCDGYDDCLNQAEELHCANIVCPGSYLCDKVQGTSAIQICIPMDEVCDGHVNCIAGDDETECGEKKCPDQCECEYSSSGDFQVHCEDGWNFDTLPQAAKISHTWTLSNSDETRILSPGLFKGFSRLKSLSLIRSSIITILPLAFEGLRNLTWLDLSYNNMKEIKTNTFDGLEKLEGLILFDVPVITIYTDAFVGLLHLRTLTLVNNDERMDVKSGGFRGLDDIQYLYVDDHRLCCHFQDSASSCTTLEPQPPLFNCGSLMQNTLLRVFMWILGISAVLGNIFVFISRLKEKTKSDSMAKQSFIISNLALSDAMMGVYMLILACADVYYGDDYFIYSDEWRTGIVCKLAGFLTLLSSEASVFFITLISIDRFLSIAFPFSKMQLRKLSSKVVVFILWLIAFALALAPTILAGPDSDYYDLSDVCIGLPLITRPASFVVESSNVGEADASGQTFSVDLPVAQESKPAWLFSIIIFLGINMACFLLILICYIVIFVVVKVSSMRVKKAQGRDDEIKLAVRMAAIVGTDFACWFPVIMMGILSQIGAVVIPVQMYTWSVVFILPINSSLNPYLYTLASLISDYRHKVAKEGTSAREGSESRETKMSKM